MHNCYISEQTNQVIWPAFIKHFKSESTMASYQADISEFMDMVQKDFLNTAEADVQSYFEYLQKRIKEGKLQSKTGAKKLTELHSFAAFICENRQEFQAPEDFDDYFYPYLKGMDKQDKYVKSVPVEHIDKILKAAENDLTAYCIIILLYRVGLSSTEITRLTLEDFGIYDNGVFVSVHGRREMCFIPEDVYRVLIQYMEGRSENEYLFYNRSGQKLNTMYISRLMKKYTDKANVPAYSAQNMRNSCGTSMFAYGAAQKQVALQLGITQTQIKRYKNVAYRSELVRKANELVKIRVEPPRS